MSTNQESINPMQLSLEQLNQIKSQLEEDLQDLGRQLEALSGARSRFGNARGTLLDLSTCETGQKILVPLNSSLYVPGKLVDPNKVIVELGTGYYCEKTVDSAIEIVDRKNHLVGKSIESVENMAMQKRKNLDQLMQVMQYKISQLQQSGK